MQYASEQLRSDKEVVLAAIKNKPASLKFALGGLNQDHACLKESGLWDKERVTHDFRNQAILSVKFSLAEKKSTPYATDFALAMKNDPLLKNFQTYNPNAWEKDSCDPDFTNIMHKCRGTQATCSIPEHDNRGSDRRPTSKSCWRFDFRFHQEECKKSNGFMLQVQENGGLGAGQRIETEMAKQVGLKIFRSCPSSDHFNYSSIGKVSKAVREWYRCGCMNRELEEIFID